MTFSESSPKPTEKDSYKQFSGFQLFYQLTYMSAIAAAGLSRGRIFELAAKLSTTVAHYFEDVQQLVESFHYDYPRACRIVGEQAKEDEVKSFLLRTSDALDSGEPLDAFLAREAGAQGEEYANEYERNLDSLKKWTDAYASLTVSQSLIVIINLISTMIYDMGTGLVLGFVIAAVAFTLFGDWVLSRAAPQERMTVAPPGGSPDQLLARRLFLYAFPAAVILNGVLYLAGVSWPWLLLLSALLIAPIGVISMRSDNKVTEKEVAFGPFLRSLGGMSSSTGTTLTEALAQIDLNSFPSLKDDVATLTMRLRARIDPWLCWQRFSWETGSQLITEAVRIFHDAVQLGGDPEEISNLCSMFTTKVALLRAKRHAVAATFNWLTIVMHAALSVLLLLILNIVTSFRGLITDIVDPNVAEKAMSSLGIPLLNYDGGQMAMLNYMTIGMVMVLIVANAIAIIASDGGFKYKVCLYLSLLMGISSVGFFIVPPVVQSVLAQAMSG